MAMSVSWGTAELQFRELLSFQGLPLVPVLLCSSYCPYPTNQEQFGCVSDTFSPDVHPHTFAFTLPSSSLCLLSVPFHAGTTRLLEEKVLECSKPLERQCEVTSDTTVADQDRLQDSVWPHHQVSPALWSVSSPPFSHPLLQLAVCLEIKLLNLMFQAVATKR